MDQWTERVKQHSIFRTIEQLEDVFSRVDSLQNKEPREQEFLARIRAVFLVVRRVLNAADPALISSNTLNNLHPQIDSIRAQLEAFLSSRGIGYLQQADAHTDNVLNFMPMLHAFGSGAATEGLLDAAAALRTTYSESLRELSEERDAVMREFESAKQMILELRGDTAKLHTSSSQLLTELQAQFSKAQEQRLTDFNTALKEWGVGYQDEITAIRDEATAVIKAASDEHAGLREQTKQAFEFEASASRTSSEKLLKEMEGYRDQAKKLLEIIGNDAIASGYGNVANAASKERRAWQVVAVVSMLSLIAITTLAYIWLETGDFRWSSLAARISVALALGILFTYAARQADKAHGTEQRNRRIELELAAIGPYLASLPEDKQVQFKILMGERTFGREQVDASATTPESALTDYVTRPEVLKILLEALTNKEKK